jgi:hypothetical protein
MYSCMKSHPSGSTDIVSVRRNSNPAPKVILSGLTSLPWTGSPSCVSVNPLYIHVGIADM